MNTYLMSLRNEPFEALLDGRKLHEFRRKFSKEKSPFQVVFYISHPVKAISGIALFDTPIESNVDALVKLIKTHDFSSEDSLRDYMSGLSQGVALPLLKIKKITPIVLEDLRELIPRFTPPQSYCKYNLEKFKRITERLDFYETPHAFEQRSLFKN